MKKSLFCQAILKFLLGVILVGALLFVPAGTVQFARGWLLMGLLFLPMFGAGLVMLRKNPALLQSRLDAKESQREQDLVVKLSGLMFCGGFVVAGLQHRFGWYTLPLWVSIMAAVLFLCAYVLYALVLKENTFLSRTIRVQEEQTVVDTGPYAIVRHPMYSATLLLFLAMPLILGSVFSLVIFLAYPAIILVRIRYEEQLLVKELPGYEAYRKKVKYRLIPYIW